jgi:hypothetical protein
MVDNGGHTVALLGSIPITSIVQQPVSAFRGQGAPPVAHPGLVMVGVLLSALSRIARHSICVPTPARPICILNRPSAMMPLALVSLLPLPQLLRIDLQQCAEVPKHRILNIVWKDAHVCSSYITRQ